MKRASNRFALSFLAVFVAGSCSDLPMGPDKFPSIGMSNLHQTPPKRVQIDIGPSTISLAPNGTPAVNVIAFSTTDFDATQVSPEDVRLIVAYQGVGAQVGTRNGSYQTSIRDFDGDGRPDRLFTFTVADLKLAGLGGCSPQLSLQGRIGEERFIGIDSTPPSFVGGAPVTSIRIVPDSVRMTISGNQQLTVKAEGPGGLAFYCGASWRSSDSTLATVDAFGLITAHGAGGPVTITAIESGLTSTAMVYVDRASQSVPATTPNTFPADLYNNPANVLENSPYFALSNAVLKDVVSVRFQEGVPQAERQTAVDLVGGEVIGGQPFDNMEGYYLVRVQDDGTGAQLRAAIDILNTLPQVGVAEAEYLHWPEEWLSFLRPQDSNNWRHWQLDPASADGENWALEAISAPMAWGCSTGSASTRIAIIDVGFRSFPDLTPNINTSQAQRYLDLYKGFRYVANDHGTRVASVLASRGNNGDGITGVMWNASMNLYDTSIDLNGQPFFDSTRVFWKAPLPIFKMLGHQLERAINSGARVVNVSQGVIGLWNRPEPEAQRFQAIKERAGEYARVINSAVNKPLIVIAAGNYPEDAFWSVLPYLAHLAPEQVLVVGGVSRVFQTHAEVSPNSATNDNSPKFEADLIQIAAPSNGVGVLGEGLLLNQTVTTATGTSFATPLVGGTAGLLFSFDPSLTAAQVKDYLIRGAQRGGRPVYGLHPTHVVNAYESLRLVAAERPGAPLCGNRVYVNGEGQLIAQRGSTPHLLATVGNLQERLSVTHGGRRVETLSWFNDRSGVVMLDNGQWKPINGTGGPDESSSGSSNSSFSYSHDRDSVVYVWPVNPSGGGGGGGAMSRTPSTGPNKASIGNRFSPQLTSASTAGHQVVLYYGEDDSEVITTLPFAPVPTMRVCITMFEGSCTAWGDVADAGYSTGFEEAAVAYAPYGDSVLVGVPHRQVTLINHGMVMCSWTTSDLYRCFFGELTDHVSKTVVWSVNLRTKVARPLWEEPGRIRWLGFSEDGKEVVVATSQSSLFYRMWSRGHFVYSDNYMISHNNCKVIFRKLPDPVGGSVPAACGSENGTFAPSLIPSRNSTTGK